MKKLHILALSILSASTLLFGTGALAQDKPAAPIELKIYNADSKSFHVNSVLLTGKKDAVLVDAQFTRADAHRVVADILASGKTLKTVYISHGDPDYYFGLEVIKAEFPDVKIFATAPTIEWIKNTVDKKVAFWGPKMGANAPRKPIVPDLLPADGLSLEDQKLEVIGLDSELPGRTCVWIPSIKAVVGGVNIYSGLHLWIADASTKEARAAWTRALERIEALKPAVVVPGHAASVPVAASDAINFSKEYLRKYELESGRTKDSATLIEAMKRQYPNTGLGIALDIGAKVSKGEMKW